MHTDPVLLNEGEGGTVIRLFPVCRGLHKVQERCAVPGARVKVPQELLERQNQIDVGDGGIECGICEHLIEKVGPVLGHLARHLDLEDLGVVAVIGMTANSAVSDLLLVTERAAPKGGAIHELASRADRLQKGLGCLGLADLGLLDLCEIGVEGRLDQKPIDGDGGRWKRKERLRNQAGYAIGLWEYSKERRGILGGGLLWAPDLCSRGHQLLELLAFNAVE